MKQDFLGECIHVLNGSHAGFRDQSWIICTAESSWLKKRFDDLITPPTTLYLSVSLLPSLLLETEKNRQKVGQETVQVGSERQEQTVWQVQTGINWLAGSDRVSCLGHYTHRHSCIQLCPKRKNLKAYFPIYSNTLALPFHLLF